MANPRKDMRRQVKPASSAIGSKRASTVPATNGRSRARFLSSERTTLADEVVGRLRTDIVSGLLKPNERLRFEELTARYGVSVSPLREALSRLAAEELVQPDAQRGYRVAAVSLSELMDILESQRTLESIALRLAIADGDDAWEAQIVATHHRLARVDKRRSVDGSDQWAREWELRHREYHQSLIAACRLGWLKRFCSQLREHLDRYRNIANVAPSRFPAIAMQHGVIAEATISRDADRATALLEQHYDAAAKVILTAMRHARPDILEAGASTEITAAHVP
jgi:GntR family transcriptional regulator, carbon starvation induced regulator